MSLRDGLFNRLRNTKEDGTVTPRSDKQWAFAPTEEMREWDVQWQGPIGVYGDPNTPETSQKNWNAYFRSRFGMSWFGGLYPNQPLPSPRIRDSSITWDKMIASAYMNEAVYLRHGGSAPVGIGPIQVQQFKESTDNLKPEIGSGPGSTWKGPNTMPWFGVVDT